MAEAKRSNTHWGWMATALVFAILIIDQIIKIWVKTHMSLGEAIHVTDWFYIEFIENNGMAYGMTFINKLVLSLFRMVAIGLIFVFLYKVIRSGRSLGYITCLSMVLAGAAGNLIDFKIISRARPDDKARLVTLLQKQNQVVAVTGDGTNDAPALSKAQVGLSMGDGTSRAKEASDITILDNSFGSIVKAIIWGRSLYLNIQRFILFQMTINICACLIVLIGAFTGLDSPLNVTQMLWVNLIMDTFAAMALSSLPANKNVLNEKPRNPQSHIITKSMAWQTVGVGLTFFLLLAGLWQLLWHCDISSVSDLFDTEKLKLFVTGMLDFSKNKQHLSTYELSVFFTFFVLLQFWNLFNAKYFKTSRSLIQDIAAAFRKDKEAESSFSASFIYIALVILIGQVLIVTFLGEMFNVSALSLNDWGWLLLITSPVLILPDIKRWISDRKQ